MNSKKIIIIGLITSCLIMAVAFSTFSQKLNYNTTGSIDTTWMVKFTKVEEVSKTSGVNVKTTPQVTDTSAYMDIGLSYPGDTITYKITVQNQGTIDAIVNTIDAKETGNKAIIMRITGIKTGDVLSAGATTTFNVVVTYNEDTIEVPTNKTNLLTLKVKYIQYVGQTITPSIDPIIPAVVQVVSGDIDTVGSELKIGEEHFYVISSDDTQVNMLAKYNLDIEGYYATYSNSGHQNSNVKGHTSSNKSDTSTRYGTLAYSSTNYWDSDNGGTCSSYPCYVYNSSSNLYTYVEGYETYLESLGAIIEDSRLIKYEELIALGCTTSNPHCGSSSYKWTYNTSYWSGSAADSSHLWYVVTIDLFSYGGFSNGSVYGGDGTYSSYRAFGVRPVITILKENI